jgi:hypothetical protein
MKKTEKIIKSFDLIKESWFIYKKNLLKFIEVFVYGLIGAIPMFGILLASGIYIGYLADKAPLLVNIILGVITFLAFVVSLYFAIIYSIQAKVASILLLKNNFTPAKENFKSAKSYIVKFLSVSILTVVLVIAWGFAFIIPALIFAIYYGFATYIVVLEDKRPFSAIESSYDLARGYFWPIFGRLALISVVGLILYSFISAPISSMDENGTPSMIYSIFVNVIWAVLSPYFIIYFYKIYESLKNVNK